MRVLFLSNVFPNPLEPHKGTFNRSMVSALAALHDVHVISPIAWSREFHSWMRGEGRVDRSRLSLVDGIPANYPRFYFPPKLMRAQYHRALWWSIAGDLRQTVSSFRPDVILSYWTHPDGTVANRLAEELSIRSVVMTGGSDVLVLARRGPRQKVVRETFRRADAVIAVSRHIGKCVAKTGIEPRKIHVVYRGVDRATFHCHDRESARRRLRIPAGQKVLVFAGRLVAVKAVRVLIDACSQLAAGNRQITCYVLGTGELERSLKRRAARLRLESTVRFCGPQQQCDLAEWYRAADLVVLPSYSEGVPNVLLEAMSCGAAFVASDVGGIPEICDPNIDLLVPPGNADALAEAIQQRLDLPEISGPRRFNPPSWQDSAAELNDVLEMVAGMQAHKVTRSSATAGRGAPLKSAAAQAALVDPPVVADWDEKATVRDEGQQRF